MKHDRFDLLDFLAGTLDDAGRSRLAAAAKDPHSSFSALRRELKGELRETEPPLSTSSFGIDEPESKPHTHRTRWLIAAMLASVVITVTIWFGPGTDPARAETSRFDYGLVADLLPQEQSDHWTIAYKHPPNVVTAAIGPNGLIAYADESGSLRVWSDGKQNRNHVLLPAGSSVQNMVWHPVLPHLLTASGRYVTLWKLPMLPNDTGHAIRLTEHRYRIESIAFSPDGRRIASLDKYGTVCIWDAHAELVKRFVAYPGTRNTADKTLPAEGHANSLTWSPDSRRILTLGGGKGEVLKLWSEYGELVSELKWSGDTDGFSQAAWTEDGSRVATKGSTRCVVWEVSDGLVPLKTIHLDAVMNRSRYIAWRNDTNIIVATGKNSATFLPTADGTVVPDSEYSGEALAWGPDGTVVITDVEAHRLVVTEDNGRTTLHTISSTAACSVDAVSRLTVGGFLAGDCQGNLISTSLRGPLGQWPKEHRAGITELVVTQDGKAVISGDSAGRVLWWNQRGELQSELLAAKPGSATGVGWLRLSPNETHVAILCTNGDLSVFQRNAEGEIADIPDLQRNVSLKQDATARHPVCHPASLAWLSETELAVGLNDLGGMQIVSENGDVRHIPVQDATGTYRMRNHVAAMAVLPNGSTLAVGSSYGHLGIWDTADFAAPQVTIPAAHAMKIEDIKWFNGDAGFATAGIDGVVAHWNSDGTNPHYFPKSETGPVSVLRMSPDGRFLAAGDMAGNVWIWNQDADRVALLKGHMGGVTDLCWSSDSKTVAVTSGYGLLRVWDVLRGDSPQAILVRPDGASLISLGPRGIVQSSDEIRRLTISYRESQGSVTLTPVD